MNSTAICAISSSPVDLEVGLNKQATASDYLPLPAELPGPTIKPAEKTIETIYWGAFGWLLLPFSMPLLLTASVLSWPLKLVRNTANFVIRGKFISSIRGICSTKWWWRLLSVILDPLCCLLFIPFALLIGDWDLALEITTMVDYPLMRCFLSWLPWPHSTTYKLFSMAKHRATNGVGRYASIEDREDEEQKRRAISEEMLRRTDGMFKGGVRGDENTLEVFKDSFRMGADLDFPNSAGFTVLIGGCWYHHHECVEWLLIQGADPNIRDFNSGATSMHHALETVFIQNVDSENLSERRHTTGFDRNDSERKRTIELLRDHEAPPNSPPNGVNFSIMDNYGRTPYMVCDAGKYPETLEALRPRPSWTVVKEVLCREGLSIEELCNALLDLIEHSNPKGSRALRRLRILDMLFCEQEGDDEELARRRKLVFDRFLKPTFLRSVQEPKIGKDVKDLLNHVFDQSAGPPREEETARSAYQTDYDWVMKECGEGMENLYGKEYNRLIAEDPNMKTLESFLKKSSKLDAKLLTHATFLKKPWWAAKKDLPVAVRALQQVGVIQSAGAFCDLIQFGHHRHIPIPNPKLFQEGPNSNRFWIALVLLWSIGIHHLIQDNFNEDMKAEAGDALYKQAPGVKAFPRSMEKALEYMVKQNMEKWKDQVYAGLHVIDVLRCSFSVDTVEENIALGRRLEAKFPVVRTKNGHREGNMSYADRKYNLVYKTTAKGIGEVAVICEVQILMKRYVEIKKVGHLLYEFQR